MTVLFTMLGYDVTALELTAALLAVAAIGLGIAGTRWMWPLYFASGVLYAWLFVEFDLYASALLQVVFVVASVWGWFTWGEAGVREPRALAPRQRLLLAAGVLAGWVVTAPLLKAVGGAATWPDAFILVASLAAQILLIAEYVEAWPGWVIINVVGVAHYANQDLWFTALLYLVLLIMGATGWRQWSLRRESVRAAAAAPAEPSA